MIAKLSHDCTNCLKFLDSKWSKQLCLQMIANYCMIAKIAQFLDRTGSKEICFHIQLSQRIKNIESNLSIPYTVHTFSEHLAKYIPLTNRVRGPYCKLWTEFFSCICNLMPVVATWPAAR